MHPPQGARPAAAPPFFPRRPCRGTGCKAAVGGVLQGKKLPCKRFGVPPGGPVSPWAIPVYLNEVDWSFDPRQDGPGTG
jgi:hypothetical protein